MLKVLDELLADAASDIGAALKLVSNPQHSVRGDFGFGDSGTDLPVSSAVFSFRITGLPKHINPTS